MRWVLSPWEEATADRRRWPRLWKVHGREKWEGGRRERRKGKRRIWKWPFGSPPLGSFNFFFHRANLLPCPSLVKEKTLFCPYLQPSFYILPSLKKFRPWNLEYNTSTKLINMDTPLLNIFPMHFSNLFSASNQSNRTLGYLGKHTISNPRCTIHPVGLHSPQITLGYH